MQASQTIAVAVGAPVAAALPASVSGNDAVLVLVLVLADRWLRPTLRARAHMVPFSGRSRRAHPSFRARQRVVRNVANPYAAVSPPGRQLVIQVVAGTARRARGALRGVPKRAEPAGTGSRFPMAPRSVVRARVADRCW